MSRTWARLLPLVLLAAGCNPTTTRPSFPPVTGAPQLEIELDVKPATEALADVFRNDSLPVSRVVPRDGLVETSWFEAGSKAVAHERILGPGVVRVRAWVDPSRAGYSKITVETVYRPVADPSLPPRELDRQVSPDHPVGARVLKVVGELVRLYSTETAAGS